MSVHPASCFHYEGLALLVRNSFSGTVLVMLKRFQTGQRQLDAADEGSLTNHSTALVVLNSSGCAQLIDASWPIPPADCSFAFSFVHRKMGSRSFLSMQMRRLAQTGYNVISENHMQWTLQRARGRTVLDKK